MRTSGEPGIRAGATLEARPGATVEARIVVVEGGRGTRRFDRLATEEPLEIRLRAGEERRTVAVTMRTPGHDFELAAGFLHNEGVLNAPTDVRSISYCLNGEADDDQQYNIVNVDLAAATLPQLDALERHFTTTSACGVCGKANLDALRVRGLAGLDDDRTSVTPQTIVALPERLREQQNVFGRRAASTPPPSSTPAARCWPFARTSGATTPSTKSSAGRLSHAVSRSPAAS